MTDDNSIIINAILGVAAKVDALAAKVDALASAPRATAAKAAPSAQAGRVATAAEMDHDKGNPEVRKDPKDWAGPSMVGRNFSDCPPEFLDMLAGLFEWMGRKDDEAGARGETDPKGYTRSGKWKYQDAALARGWAARLRANPTTYQGRLGI